MRPSFRFVAVFTACLSLLSAVLPTQANPNKLRLRAAVTELLVYNGSNQSVTTWIILGQNVAGCSPNLISNIQVTRTDNGQQVPVATPIPGEPFKGKFTLQVGDTVQISRRSGNCFNGEICFGAIPFCPCGFPGAPQPVCPGGDPSLPQKLPNGVNGFECNINNGPESVDITCVNGANSFIKASFEGGGAWLNPVTLHPVSFIQNGAISFADKTDDNCSRPGVFPFNASDCIQTPLPPCGAPICFHAKRDCQLDRTNGAGGSIKVSLVGFSN